MSVLNQPTYKYIAASVLIDEVKNMLSSYFDQGSLDESIMWPKVRWCLDKLGLKVYPFKSTVIQINDHQGKLPKDFHKLSYAIGCGSCEQWEDINGFEQNIPVITEKRVWEIPACKTRFDYCTNECGEMYEIVQSFDQFKYRYFNTFNIRVSASEKYCTNDCVNNQYYGETREISIRNGFMYTNFNGSVYMDYVATMEDESEDLLIPDYGQITEWVKMVLMVECFSKLFWNGENTVAQRLQLAQQMLTVKEQDMVNFKKMNEMQDFYDLRNILKARYFKYDTAIRGQTNYRGQSAVSRKNQYM